MTNDEGNSTVSENIVNSTVVILQREQEMTSVSRSTWRSSQVAVHAVTPNLRDSGPAMIPNEAPDNEKVVLNMQPIEQVNIYPDGFSQSEGPMARRNEVSDTG